MRTLQRNLILKLKENLKAFPYHVSNIKIEETHISWILLTGKYAYKIKKELKFGNVLNFSNLKLRKKYCQIEVVLNKVLCNEMYLAVC